MAIPQVILSLFTLLCSFVGLKQSAFLAPAAIALVFQIYLYLWFHRLLLELEGDVLRYYSIPKGLRELEIAEISSIEIQAGEKSYRDKFRPPLRLAVEAYPSSSKESFDVNIKFFDRGSLAKLLARIDEIRGVG